MRAGEIASEDAGGQPERRLIGPRHRVVLVLEGCTQACCALALPVLVRIEALPPWLPGEALDRNVGRVILLSLETLWISWITIFTGDSASVLGSV